MKTKRIKATLAIVLMGLIVSISAWAATVYVTGTHVRLRLTPALSGKIYTDMNGNPIYPQKGQVLKWSGETSNGFYEVYYVDRWVWISKQFAKVQEDRTRQTVATRQYPAYIEVTGTRVNLRKGPSMNSSVITVDGVAIHPKKGEQIKCIGSEGDFWKLDYVLPCYISKQFCKPIY